jgi:DNA-binding SARP family transcriptional activator
MGAAATAEAHQVSGRRTTGRTRSSRPPPDSIVSDRARSASSSRRFSNLDLDAPDGGLDLPRAFRQPPAKRDTRAKIPYTKVCLPGFSAAIKVRIGLVTEPGANENHPTNVLLQPRSMMLDDVSSGFGASNPFSYHPDLRLRLMGQMQATTGAGEIIPVLGRRTRMLLAILALSNYPVPRHRLVRMLWSTRSEQQRRASLRQEIHRLQEMAGSVAPDLIRVNRDHMTIRHERIWVDAVEALTATVQNPAPLSLLSGVLLDGYDHLDPTLDEWLATEREKLRIHARAVLEGQLALQTAPEGTLAVTGQLLQFDPAHESAWRARIQAYAALGNRGLAIEAYEQCRAALTQKLGAVPCEETQRLVASIRQNSDIPQPYHSPATTATMLPVSAVHAGLRIGVLPFQLSGMEPEHAFLSVALADEITTALSPFPGIGLIAPSTLASCAAHPEALRQRCGLDILVEGRLYPAFDSVRLNLQLTDLRDQNRLIWSKRFQAPRTDLPGLHDDVVGQMAAQIDLEIQVHESRRASLVPIEQSNACELVLRAWPITFRFHRPEFDEAEALLRRAIMLEPDYAASHSRLAYHLLFAVGQGWAPDRQAAIDEATVRSERAMSLAPRGARALAVAGHVRAYLHRRPKEAMELHERALSLNSNLALAWCCRKGPITVAGRRDGERVGVGFMTPWWLHDCAG